MGKNWFWSQLKAVSSWSPPSWGGPARLAERRKAALSSPMLMDVFLLSLFVQTRRHKPRSNSKLAPVHFMVLMRNIQRFDFDNEPLSDPLVLVSASAGGGGAGE